MTSKSPSFDMAGVSRETLEQLEIYERELLRWQKVKNLVAPSTLDNLWQRHFADSAQLLRLRPKARVWADLGSGAGFPGLVIAILLKGQAGALVHLIESDHRKCAFLRELARTTSSPAIVHNGRVETVLAELQNIEIVTARALAPLNSLISLAMPALEEGATGLFLKGQDVEEELTGDPIFSRVELKFIPSTTSANSQIVEVKACL